MGLLFSLILLYCSKIEVCSCQTSSKYWTGNTESDCLRRTSKDIRNTRYKWLLLIDRVVALVLISYSGYSTSRCKWINTFLSLEVGLQLRNRLTPFRDSWDSIIRLNSQSLLLLKDQVIISIYITLLATLATLPNTTKLNSKLCQKTA